MEVEMLSRLQFAGTIMFHYLFPPLSIGLGLQLFLTELAFVRTGNPAWEAAAHIQLVPPNFYISNWCHPTFTQRAYSPYPIGATQLLRKEHTARLLAELPAAWATVAQPGR